MYMYIKHYVDKNSINSSSSYILNKQCSSPLEMQNPEDGAPSIHAYRIDQQDHIINIQ